MVRLRQLFDGVRHRLVLTPTLFILGGLALSRLTLEIDSRADAGDFPQILETTVPSARSILTAIAGGLITSVTLLLSMMLVAVQLASSQFSPRTVRDWLGDRTQQRAIGIVLGTVVYCLMVMRETRTLSDGEALTPHTSVLVAVVLGVASLIAVVVSVDHLTNGLRVGSVATHLLDSTMRLIESSESLGTVPASDGDVDSTVARSADDLGVASEPPSDALAISAEQAGFVQQIDVRALLNAAPEGSTIHVAVAVGSFVFPNSQIAWVSPRPEDEESCIRSMRAGIALGEERTMQEDVGFGILQMVDIAVRALSPGINDPNTANDLIHHLGVVVLAIWERDPAPAAFRAKGRTLIRPQHEHAQFLDAAFDPIRIHGMDTPSVGSTLLEVLATLHAETQRRNLPGPLQPIEDMIDRALDQIDRSELGQYDRDEIRRQVRSIR